MWGNAHDAILTPLSRNMLGKGNAPGVLGLTQGFPRRLPAGGWWGWTVEQFSSPASWFGYSIFLP
jgi:hypothetical protein